MEKKTQIHPQIYSETIIPTDYLETMTKMKQADYLKIKTQIQPEDYSQIITHHKHMKNPHQEHLLKIIYLPIFYL